MSDAVILSLISTFGTVVVAYFAMRTNQKVNRVDTKMTNVETKVDDNTKITNEVKTEVSVVKAQTDGMHTELVETKLLLGEAIGKAAGKAEQKRETDADNAKLAPEAAVKVEVINGPLQVVTPKEEKKGNEGDGK